MYLHISAMVKELLRKLESIEERLDALSENVGTATVNINWGVDDEEEDDEESDTESTESAQSAPF